MSKQIDYELEDQKEMISGVHRLARTSVITLGPKEQNVVFKRMYGSPVMSSDGVTPARQIIAGAALAVLVVKKLRLALKIAAVKAPGFGDRNSEMLITIGCAIRKKREQKEENVMHAEK